MGLRSFLERDRIADAAQRLAASQAINGVSVDVARLRRKRRSGDTPVLQHEVGAEG